MCSFQISLDKKQALFIFVPGVASTSGIVESIEDLGFDAKLTTDCPVSQGGPASMQEYSSSFAAPPVEIRQLSLSGIPLDPVLMIKALYTIPGVLFTSHSKENSLLTVWFTASVVTASGMSNNTFITLNAFSVLVLSVVSNNRYFSSR